MREQQTPQAGASFDEDGFLKVMSNWDRSMAQELAEKHDIGPLTDPGATATTWTPTTSGDEHKVRVRAFYGDGIYGSWDQSDDVFSVVGPVVRGADPVGHRTPLDLRRTPPP